MAILAVMGFGKQLDTVTAFLGIILPITAGGGLVNKALDASVEKQRALLTSQSFKDTVDELVKEVEKARDELALAASEKAKKEEGLPAS